ncbi:hypothetical protein PC117_g26211 [Phytophthora cactorum]|uniref:Uncharacterized protein n=1 Tax=Phytophthora cactorum TaxID=29920 RepID=A0A8T1ALZ4_9STRA|nr:hypothetical protein PC117_g26211 [Phytophthora cactorum]
MRGSSRHDHLPKRSARLLAPTVHERCPRLVEGVLGHGACHHDSLAARATPALESASHLSVAQQPDDAAAVIEALRMSMTGAAGHGEMRTVPYTERAVW